jgi:ABC-2 type transport system ATP-binding protein
MKDAVIDVRDFRKQYGDFVAVKDISFKAYAGEIFGLLGPNGAGKTSTLESLEGLRQPDGGSISILGIDPVRQSRQLRNLVGVQLQSSGLPANMTVDEAMKFFCAYHDVSPRYDLIDRFGLAEKRKEQYEMLSIGQQRRLALVLAIAHQPKVLFLDEPTAGLDVPSRIELHQIMEELKQKGTTIILATHDMAEAEKMADRVAILLKGEVVAEGSPTELTATGKQLTKVSVASERSVLHDNGVVFTGVKQQKILDEYMIYYTSETGPTVSQIISHLEKVQDTLIDLRVERPTLEERFLEITHLV